MGFYQNRMLVGVATGALFGGAVAFGAERPVDFRFEVQPILSDRCIACHGPDKAAAKAKLQLHTFKTATADRKDGPALVPGDLEKSHIWQRITDTEDPMPPLDSDRKPLTAKEKDIMRRWIQQGGVYEEHWAFVPPERSEVPAAEKPARGLKKFGRALFAKRDKSADSADRMAWQANPIDRFILKTLDEKAVSPAPEADRATLARRASLALIGLPPEPEWVRQFLTDEGPDAFGKYVDRLLSDPLFGEHQARYWLDAVRYGDTHGLHLDNRRGIYPYRDWVVRAFNQNLPFDEFIRWQISGDMLPNPTLEQLTASGYVRMNPSTAEGGAIADEFHVKNTFDRTENFATVFLGMTFNCARCHTHKYDPIKHSEYYSLFAFLNNTAESPLDGNKEQYGNIARVPKNQAEWDKWGKVEAKLDVALKRFGADDTKILAFAKSDKAPKPKKGQPDHWGALRKAGSISGLSRDAQIAVWSGADDTTGKGAELTALLSQRAALQKGFTTTLVAQERSGAPKPAHILERGEYDKKGEVVKRGTPEIMGPFPEGAPLDRRGLAEWLVGRRNPLVSRVLVNRIWQRTFGEGLVRTPEDFGMQGQAPTHPELMDWLSVEFMESGWNVKALLKAMVTSQTFRQSSQDRETVVAVDPENYLWARGPRHRLDAEVLRDQALWASGLLKPLTGGEGVKPYQPSGMWKAMAHPASNTKQYTRDKGERLFARSLYVYWKRTSPHPMMTLFDAPNRESGCVARSRTSTPLQSLALFNETQRLELGRGFAARLMREGADDSARLQLMFQLLASRAPTATEQAACDRLLQQMLTKFRAAPEDAKALLTVGDLPQSADLDVVSHAAWTQLAMTVLASDLSLLQY